MKIRLCVVSVAGLLTSVSALASQRCELVPAQMEESPIVSAFHDIFGQPNRAQPDVSLNTVPVIARIEHAYDSEKIGDDQWRNKLESLGLTNCLDYLISGSAKAVDWSVVSSDEGSDGEPKISTVRGFGSIDGSD